MDKNNKTALIIAFIIVLALLLSGAMLSGGMMGNGAMGGISWMWIPTLLMVGLVALRPPSRLSLRYECTDMTIFDRVPPRGRQSHLVLQKDLHHESSSGSARQRLH